MFSVAGAQAPWPKESQAHAPTAGGFLEDRDHILKRSHLSEMRHKHPLKTSEEHISSPRHSMGLPEDCRSVGVVDQGVWLGRQSYGSPME